MVTVNVVVLAGTLADDPVVRTLPSGDMVTSLRLQVPEPGKRLLPLAVSAWSASTRKAASGLTKGDKVMVAGHIERRFFKGDGGGRAITEVVAREVRQLVPATG
ncbi:MAG TPA: single-stranded DNA-binding protein [Actinomycetota bacterium]|nr:single-stranded DNA-binding protein [Actinomycetota bacterium]